MKTLILVILFAASAPVFGQKIILKEDFSGNINQWLIQNDLNDSIQIADGKYVMEGLNDNTIFSVIPANLGNTKSYSISVLAEHVKGADNYGYGIHLINKKANNSYSFVISSIGFYKFYGNEKGRYKQFADWTEHPSIKKGNNAENKLTMTREDRNWKLFINEKLIGTVPITISIKDPSVGFITSNKQKVVFDDFEITMIQ